MNESELIQQAFPAQEPDGIDRTAVRSHISDRVTKTTHRRRTRRVALSMAFGSLLVLAGVMAGPSAYAVFRLRQIAGSVGDVQSAILEDFRLAPNGVRTLRGRTTYADGKWRIERKGEVSVYVDGTLKHYNPDERRVVVMKKPDGPFSYNPSGFSVSAMISDLARWNWRQSISTGTTTLNGKHVDSITLTHDSGRERTIIYADRQTHFPLEYRSEVSTASGWLMRGACIPQFNVSVDPKSFELQVPAGTKVVDLEVEQLAWKKKLEGKLAVLDFEGTKIVVRDIAVNSRGHVFIVFTNGETAEDRAEYGRQVRARNADKAMRRSKRFTRPTWEVTDSLGLRYVPTDGSFQPFVGHPNFDEVVLADGQVLQGDWLMPKEPSQWRPRTLTLTASIDVERNPVARSYKAEFEHPTAALIPDWMSLCTIGPHNERELLNEERRTRRQFLREDGDWTALEASLREDLADILDQEAKGQTYAKSTIYFQLYEALLKTGKRQEALDFLRLAEKEPNQGHEGQIRAALKKEGL